MNRRKHIKTTSGNFREAGEELGLTGVRNLPEEHAPSLRPPSC